MRAIQDELTAVAAAKRGGKLDSQRRFVDACVKADSVALAQLGVLLAKREELEEQIAAGQSAHDKAAEKRAGAEAHLAELHSRMALEAVPAAAAAARPLAITVEDTLLFQGILQHIDPAAIRATCLAAGGETVEQVSGRVAALTTKLGAIAAAAAATATAAPPTVACALSGAAGAGMEPALAGVPCRAAAPACDAKGPAPPARGPAAEAGEGGDADGRSMWLDAEDQEELDQIVAELGVPRIPPEL